MFIYWSGTWEKTVCFLDVTSPSLKDAQMYAWIPLLSPGLPTASCAPAHGRAEFWKGRDLMYKLYACRERGKGGEPSLICTIEVSNPIPSPGNCAPFARSCVWSTWLSFNPNRLHRHSGGWEKSYILQMVGKDSHGSSEIDKAISRTVRFRRHLGTVMPKNSHWITSRAVQAIGGHVCKWGLTWGPLSSWISKCCVWVCLQCSLHVLAWKSHAVCISETGFIFILKQAY